MKIVFPRAARVLHFSALWLILTTAAYGIENEQQKGGATPSVVDWSSGSEPVVSLAFGKPFKINLSPVDTNRPMAVRDLPVWMKRDGTVLFGNAVEPGTFKLEVKYLEESGWSQPKPLKIVVPERSKTPITVPPQS